MVFTGKGPAEKGPAGKGTVLQYKRVCAAALMLIIPLIVCAQTGTATGTQTATQSAPEATTTEAAPEGEVNKELSSAPAEVAILPIISKDAPAYTGLLITKLLEQNFSRTEVLAPVALPRSSDATEENKKLADELSRDQLTEELAAIGNRQGSSYVAAGTISKEGMHYSIEIMVVNAKNARLVLVSEKTAVGLEDVDRVVMDITEEFIAAEFSPPVQEKVRQIRQTEAEEDEQFKDELADLEEELEERPEEDPEEIIERLPEKVKEAFIEKAKEEAKEEAKKEAKEEAREEVVQEEIQNLYDQEKRQRQEERARKIQKYSLLGLYGVRLTADIFDALSVQSRIQEAQYWSNYMMMPYADHKSYSLLNDRTRTETATAYISGGIAGVGLSAAQWVYYPDVFTLTSTGRSILAASQAMYTLGAMGTLAAGYFGIESIIYYSKYQEIEYADSGQTGLDEAYEKYRSRYEYYSWTQLGAYSVQAAGLLGTAVAFAWPGTRDPLHLTAAGQGLVSVGNILYGAAALARNISLNYALRETEDRISALGRGVSDNNNSAAAFYETVAVSSGITALTLYAASTISTVWGLCKTSVEASPQREYNKFRWGFVPYGTDGVSVSFQYTIR